MQRKNCSEIVDAAKTIAAKCVFTRKPTKVDAFVVRVSENAEILNLKQLEKWVRNKGYFRYDVYRNSEGGMVFKVFNYQDRILEFRNLENMDVLFYSLGKDGKRISAASCPIWDSGVDFTAKFE